MKHNRSFVAVSVAVAFASLSAGTVALATVNVAQNNSASALVAALVDTTTVNVTSSSFTGEARSAGTFVGGTSAGLGFDEGVILASGRVIDAAGPNNSDGTSTIFTTAGDADLTVLAGAPTFDAAALTFTFTADAGDDLLFRYHFASEEYNEFANGSFNDAFGFFLDGTNIALLPSTNTPVTINDVNATDNPNFYNNNDPSDFANPPFDIEYDGFTTLFTAAIADLTAGSHTIKLVVADAADRQVDSAVFLEGDAFIINQNEAPVADANGPYLVLLGQASLTLSSAGTTDDGIPGPLSFAWDLDNDGQFDDAFIANPTINDPVTYFGGLGSYPVALQVFDGQFFDVSTSVVNVIPEPATLAALAGLAGLVLRRRRA